MQLVLADEWDTFITYSPYILSQIRQFSGLDGGYLISIGYLHKGVLVGTMQDEQLRGRHENDLINLFDGQLHLKAIIKLRSLIEHCNLL